MNNKIPRQSPEEVLEARKQELAQKHQHQLHRMTQTALLPQQSYWQKSWFKPAMATAFSVMLVTTLILLNTSDQSHESASTDLPEWVTNTNVPLTLIENLEFYNWLAQQPEYQQARYQQYGYEKAITLAANDYYQYRFGQRLTSGNVTQRVFGTTPDSGKDQREGI